MDNLKEFMLLFRMQPSNNQPTAEQIATMQGQWQNFIGSIASEAKLVNISRLGSEGAVIKNDLSTSSDIFVEDRISITGNLTMKAENIEEVIETAKQCPILLAGGIVEVRRTIPMQ